MVVNTVLLDGSFVTQLGKIDGVWGMEYGVWGYGSIGYGSTGVWQYGVRSMGVCTFFFILIIPGSISHSLDIIIIPVIIIIHNHVCKCVKSTMGVVKL